MGDRYTVTREDAIKLSIMRVAKLGRCYVETGKAFDGDPSRLVLITERQIIATWLTLPYNGPQRFAETLIPIKAIRAHFRAVCRAYGLS